MVKEKWYLKHRDKKVVQVFYDNNKEVLFINGKRIVEYAEICDVVVNSDMTRCALLVKDNGKKFIWLDGIEHPSYKNIILMHFDNTGTHFVYLAELEDGKKCMVYDGKRGKAYDRISHPEFNETGVLAYKAFSSDENKWCMVVDGKEDKWYEDVSGCLWGPNGHYAYTAQNNNVQFVVLDGKEERRCDSADTLQFKLVPHFVCIYRESGIECFSGKDLVE